MDKFNKLRIALRYRLQGAASADPAFKVALAAFDFAEKHTTGFRKDGVTPNFMHPMEVMAYLMTLLPSLRHPAETLATGILHDVVEDDPTVTLDEIDDKFGRLVCHAERRLSKKIGGIKVYSSLAEYFDFMLDCPIATLAKGSDRINNQGTMVGPFSPAKQLEQCDETETYILPMLKKARRIYSDQEAALENMKLVLNNQIRLVRAMHNNPGAANPH